MSAPTCGDLKMIKRVLRYLRQAGPGEKTPLRMAETTPSHLCVYGCRLGWVHSEYVGVPPQGVCMLGSHMIQSWSCIQASVGLSSAESELYASVKASSEALGLISTASGLNMTLEATVLLDSSAAQGIISRQGKGKVKHIRTQQLWVQEAAADGLISYKKSIAM